jgi:hypothetical protein
MGCDKKAIAVCMSAFRLCETNRRKTIVKIVPAHACFTEFKRNETARSIAEFTGTHVIFFWIGYFSSERLLNAEPRSERG